MKKTTETEFTNMVMIEDGERVLVQRRVLYWRGIAFPGGHVERGESFVCAAAREVCEETGLNVSDLRLAGTVNWENLDTGARYVVFLYRTSSFTGTLIPATEEGENFWVRREELRSMELCPNFAEYLPIFFGEGFTEMYGTYGENIPDTLHLL